MEALREKHTGSVRPSGSSRNILRCRATPKASFVDRGSN